MNDGKIVCNSRSYEDNDLGNHYFVIVDSVYNPIRTIIEKNFKSGYGTGPSKMIYKVGDDVFAYTPFLPEIYKISSDKTEEAFRLSFGNYSIPPLDFLMEKSNGGKKSYFGALEESNYVSYYNISEASDYMSVVYIVNKQKYIGFYDKRNGKTYVYKLEFFQERLGVSDSYTYLAGMIDDCCVVPLDINALIDLKDDGYEFPVELSSLVEKAGADDNPILLTVRLK